MNQVIEHNPTAEAPPPRVRPVKRRHGACTPCKLSKTAVSLSVMLDVGECWYRFKCGGGLPCDACCREKRKPGVCEYSEKALNIQASREENELKRRRDGQSTASDDSDNRRKVKQARREKRQQPIVQPGPSSDPIAPMHAEVSLNAVVGEVCRHSFSSSVSMYSRLMKV